jgi:hypothetical protein
MVLALVHKQSYTTDQPYNDVCTDGKKNGDQNDNVSLIDCVKGEKKKISLSGNATIATHQLHRKELHQLHFQREELYTFFYYITDNTYIAWRQKKKKEKHIVSTSRKKISLAN